MVDDKDLEGLDPYDLMAAEAQRLDRFFSGAADDIWKRPSLAGWSVRDVLATASTEDYNQACLDGTVAQFLADVETKGASDLATANDIGIHEFDGQTPAAILATWRTTSTEHREAFRARRQERRHQRGRLPRPPAGLHLAFELATHADDVEVPLTGGCGGAYRVAGASALR
jgi:uncharacterized protein (TIGR03083 family)